MPSDDQPARRRWWPGALPLTALMMAPGFAAPVQAGAPLLPYERCTEAMVADPVDSPAAIRACQQPAEAGITGAQYALGELLAAEGPTRNLKAAVRWYRLAAEGGNPAAQYALALILANGLGVDVDHAAALHYLGMSYCAGFPVAVETVETQETDPTQFGCAAVAPPALDGVWSGELTRVDASPGAGGAKGEPVALRLTIGGIGGIGGDEAVTVEIRDGAAWTEVKPGRFHLERRQGSAVAYSLDDGWDFDGNWVEAWTFSLVHVDGATLAATWSRTVENLQVPAASGRRTITEVATGRLARETAGEERH